MSNLTFANQFIKDLDVKLRDFTDEDIKHIKKYIHHKLKVKSEKRSIAPSAWRDHIKKIAAENAGMSAPNIAKLASKTYKKE